MLKEDPTEAGWIVEGSGMQNAELEKGGGEGTVDAKHGIHETRSVACV